MSQHANTRQPKLASALSAVIITVVMYLNGLDNNDGLHAYGNMRQVQLALALTKVDCKQWGTKTPYVRSDCQHYNDDDLVGQKGCMGKRFCNAVVWIAELTPVKKVGNQLKLV